ncbi:class I SAM-dependent methyltransferase [Motilibacter aurantiacus]|uniref:class I SAM-dependent methyltransferase n=1 Tax=Motilibacter aurantiacus TaxID=2714955 RepID=UPI00140BEAB6|nr:class I SAM-dependent methyltransferase [Motilibacter aurantiacus]NHC44318.1 class I SAM-dependent methyltransferase [Motilibacter aurantiacus]
MPGQLPDLEFLGRLHGALRPAAYLEIGVGDGGALALSRARSIGIDPGFAITAPLRCDVALYRTTSDDYFARPEPLAHFHGAPVDLAFVRGRSSLQPALRDVINLELSASPSSVLVLDGMVSTDGTGAYDAHGIVSVLREHRPDLTLLPVDTGPRGLLLLTGLDPESTVLLDRYDAIVTKHAAGAAGSFPDRVEALPPEALLRSPVWGALRRARRPWMSRDRALVEMAEALEHPKSYRARRRGLRRAATRTVRQAVRQARGLRAG